ncbi:MAG: hypothetical protein IJH73_06875, partial [Lachnospiraceae bacterium]|nr:hypothetical protein [Lachnospiraceae bacterium]
MSESIPAGPAPASAPKPRLWTANFILALLVNVGSSVGFYFVQPVLTPSLEGLGIALTITGIISGMFSFAALAVRPFTGILSDRISPKLILAFTLPWRRSPASSTSPFRRSRGSRSPGSST